MSPLTIKQTILRVLNVNRPYAVPAEQLLAEVNRLVRPALTAEELRPHLRFLLDRNMVAFLADELDPENQDARRWLIREAGQAQLKS